MSGIGFWELIILSLIGLVVLGPERLPRVANQIGSWLGQARRMTRVMKRQLEDELNFADDLNIKPPNREPSSQPTNTTPREDDHHSEAHEKDEIGTGVGDQDRNQGDDDLAVSKADQDKEKSTIEEEAETADEMTRVEETTKESS